MRLREKEKKMNHKTFVILVLLGLLAVGCTRPPARTPEAGSSRTMPPVQTSTPLGKHPNLYLSFRLSLPRGPASIRRDNVLDDSGNVRQEWLDLIEDYPDRFVMGSDTFWGGGEAGPSQTLVASFLTQLPGDVAQMVACRNVVAIYKLDAACP
jgi:hypothetical protein